MKLISLTASCTVAHDENSDVRLSRVAVAVTFVPAGLSTGTVTSNGALPAPATTSWVVPSSAAPSPTLLPSQSVLS